jgi:hypothetical protein
MQGANLTPRPVFLLLCLLQAPAFAMTAEQPAQATIRDITVHGQVDPRLQRLTPWRKQQICNSGGFNPFGCTEYRVNIL